MSLKTWDLTWDFTWQDSNMETQLWVMVKLMKMSVLTPTWIIQIFKAPQRPEAGMIREVWGLVLLLAVRWRETWKIIVVHVM